MNIKSIRHALSLDNLALVSEITKIPPHILGRIVDGNQQPTANELDALAGYFRGEYTLGGNDSTWKRIRKPNTTYGTLPIACPTLPPPDIEYDPWAPPPNLGIPVASKGTGVWGEGFTGTGVKVK